jgi:hypothetical protein
MDGRRQSEYPANSFPLIRFTARASPLTHDIEAAALPHQTGHLVGYGQTVAVVNQDRQNIPADSAPDRQN